MDDAHANAWPGESGVPDLSRPAAYEEEHGQGTYVGAVEEALKGGQIRLSDIQKRFKDYKCSQMARDHVCIVARRGNEKASNLLERHGAEYDTSSMCEDELIEFEVCFKQMAAERPELELDGAGKASPLETLLLYRGLQGIPFVKQKPRQDIPESQWYKFEDKKQRGDTMNSFGSTFCCCMGVPSKGRRGGIDKAFEKYASGWRCDDGSWSDKKAQLALLAYLTHTAGNFIPMLSGGRNTPNQIHSRFHGGDGAGDRWDLFLSDIRIWYLRNKDPKCAAEYEGKKEGGDAYMRFAENSAETPNPPCYEWLNGFDSFDDFVARNYLDDYVISDDAIGGHKSKDGGVGGSLEVTRYADEVTERLVQMNARIIARGNRMWEAMLKLASFIFGHGDEPRPT